MNDVSKDNVDGFNNIDGFPEGLDKIPEKDFTCQSFKESLKKWGATLLATIIVNQLIKLGAFGEVTGWIFIIFMGIFSLWAFLGIFLSANFILSPNFFKEFEMKTSGWKVLQIILSGLNGIFYISMGLIIYLKM